MQAFLASDVDLLAARRAADPAGARTTTASTARRSPPRSSCRTSAGSTPATSATSSTRTRASAAAPTRQPAPGPHGHGLARVKRRRHRPCSPAPRSTASRPAAPLAVRRHLPNQGENDETQRHGHRRRSPAVRKPITLRKKRLNLTKAGATATVTIQLATSPPTGSRRRSASPSRRSPASRRSTTTRRPTPSCSPSRAACQRAAPWTPADLDRRGRASRIAACAVALVALAVARSSHCVRAAAPARAPSACVLGDRAAATSSPTPPSSSRSSAALHAYVEDVAARLDGAARRPPRSASTARSPTAALVRYDAYNEMSGRQSARSRCSTRAGPASCSRSIHHRDQARLYAKQVDAGSGRARALARGGRGGARSRSPASRRPSRRALP